MKTAQLVFNSDIMVQAISLLTVLRMLAEAQTSCNFGAGRIVYEKLPNQQLQGFDDDVLRESAPPMKVLEKCQDLCLRDRTAANSLVRICTSIDFQPGKRLSLPSSGSSFINAGLGDYEESVCHLSREQARPEGLGTLVAMPGHYHFNEVCLGSYRLERECPNRKFVFERLARKRFRSPSTKDYFVSNRTECEEKCLNEYSFVCRSASYDTTSKTCTLSRYTRRTHPELMEDDPGFDYLENTCLSEDRRCEGQAVFIREQRAQIVSPFDAEVLRNTTAEDCQRHCLVADTYFCRSVTFDPVTQSCVLSGEDSASLPDNDAGAIEGSGYQYYEVMCVESGNEVNPINSRGDGDTSPLFADGRRRDILTAFQRYRNSRLSSDFQTEITDRSLAECLDECLRQSSYRCRSAMYSERYRVCRLSRFEQRDGRLIYDPDYDYYESLMDWSGSNNIGSGIIGSNDGSYANNYPNYGSNTYGSSSVHGTNSFGSNSGSGSSTSFGSNSGFGSNTGYGSSGSFGSNTGYGSSGGFGSNTGYGSSGSFGSNSGFGSNPGYGSNNFYGSNNPPITPRPSYNVPSKDFNDTVSNTSIAETDADDGGIVRPSGSATLLPDEPVFGGSGSWSTGGTGSTFGAGAALGPGFPGAPLGPGGKPRCDGREDGYRSVGSRLRIRRQYVRRYLAAASLFQCEQECTSAKDFRCQSFNFYRLPLSSNAIGGDRENCELSDRTTRDLDINNPSFFETNGDYDFYERSFGGGDCLDVSQTCSEDGMEFILRTPEGFTGRIYTHGFYDRCFFRGTGGPSNVLRITGPRGYPDCGTQRSGDILTNIVVVQFSEMVQTSRDKRYNLTCMFGGPGEAVVTSGYIGAGSGSPTPIEYLPAQNILDSKVRLLILYQGRPTTTIAVGDPLTFKLESLAGYNLISDIFATNVIAKDPYTGKSVQLIDRFGCPIDDGIFPPLDRARNGEGLEARFNAFKIPESNFLVFEATVKSCRGGCQPVVCNTNTGRGPGYSLGRKKREASEGVALNKPAWQRLSSKPSSSSTPKSVEENEEELVMEMLRVYANRDEMPSDEVSAKKIDICLSQAEFYGLISSLIIVLIIMIIAALVAGLCFRRYRLLNIKNVTADSTSPNHFFGASYGQRSTGGAHTVSARNFAFMNRGFEHTSSAEIPATIGVISAAEGDLGNNGKGQQRTRRMFEDPSEPIYTEPSLFERSRSLRSVAASDVNRAFTNEDLNTERAAL